MDRRKQRNMATAPSALSISINVNCQNPENTRIYTLYLIKYEHKLAADPRPWLVPSVPDFRVRYDYLQAKVKLAERGAERYGGLVRNVSFSAVR